MWGKWIGLKAIQRIALLAAMLIIAGHGVQAQIEPRAGQLIRTMYPNEWGTGSLTDFTYAADLGLFFALMDDSTDRDATGEADLILFTPYGDIVDSVRLNGTDERWSKIGFDNVGDRLLLLNSALTQLFQMALDDTGRLTGETQLLFDTTNWGLGSVSGMAVDHEDSTLFILDSVKNQIVKTSLDEGSDGTEVEKIDLSHLAAGELLAVAVDPNTDHLYVLSAASQTLYELTLTGQLVSHYDVSAAFLTGVVGMVFAPSADLTDPGDVTHLFIVGSSLLSPQEARVANDAPHAPSQMFLPSIAGNSTTVEQAAINTGRGDKIVELALNQRGLEGNAANVVLTTLPLVQTVDTSIFSPPSPDPSGITYISTTDILFLTDGEVDEMDAYFTGDNLFGSTRNGTLDYTATTLPFSHEPTDAAYNINDGHIFYSDDNRKKIFEVDPGPDGVHGTDDDILTSFLTSDFDSIDPEGLSHDPLSGDLFIADGTNREVYRVARGPNGVFDGVSASGGDDIVTHFDVLALGIEDPEGIHFEPATGNLIMTGNSITTLYELTTSGSIVATYDISAANMLKPAGVVMAPGSANPDQASYYLVDRGIDNNEDPLENDGKLYEFSADMPWPTATPTVTPTVTPTTTVTLTPSATATPTVTPTPTNTITPSMTPTRGPTNTPWPTPTATPLQDIIFADDFESGDLSLWSNHMTGNGDLSVSPASALVGSQGLQAVIDDNFGIYVTDVQPMDEPRYRVRFHFHPNSIAMADGDSHYLFCACTGSSQLIRAIFRYSQGEYQLRVGLVDDSAAWKYSDWLPIENRNYVIELDWQAATAAGVNDGYLSLWLDGGQMADLTNVDNDTIRIDQVRLGAVSGIDDGTRGTYYFDAFESRRESYIGPVGAESSYLLPFVTR